MSKKTTNPYAFGTAEYHLWELRDAAQSRARAYDEKAKVDMNRYANLANQARAESVRMDEALKILVDNALSKDANEKNAGIV